MSTTTNEQATSVAKDIIRYLGGNKFIAMTGANNFTSLRDDMGGVVFRIGRNKGPHGTVSHVRVILNYDDSFTMTFIRVRGVKVTEVQKFVGLYCDQLEDTFKEVTGMATRLF